MGKVIIKEVLTKKDRKEFVHFPLRLYKGNDCFVPPLYADEMNLFGDKNIYSKICGSVFFLAVRDGKTVGRIQGIIQRQYNEIHGVTQARFTRFDCIDEQEVATALFTAVEEWARQNGMTEMVGPLGYSDLEREGMLIEGFEYLATFEEQYNYPYYPALVEGCGYGKDVDWLESRLFSFKEDEEKMDRIFERTLNKHNLHVADKSVGKKAFINKYKKGIFNCLDECYKELYGTVPFTEEMQQQMIEQFTLLITLDYIAVVCDENEEVVAFGLCLPGIGKAVQKSGGKLTLPCLLRIFKAVKQPQSIDFALIGIMPKYRNSGLSVFMVTILKDMLKKSSLEYMETNLNLETNYSIQMAWKHFDRKQHKRRRSYIKKL